MPVVVLYKEKSIPVEVGDRIAEALADTVDKLLEAKIEVRVVEPVSSYNSNPIHLEIRFRDFGEYNDELLGKFHNDALTTVGALLRDQKIECKYSIYIIPTATPRSMWAQQSS